MKQPTPWWMWLLPLPVVWWAALLTAGAWQPGMDLLQLMAGLSTVLQRPWDIRWTQYSGRCLLLFTLAYAVGIGMALSNTTATRRGEEHGSARWGDVFSIARRYRDKRGGKHGKDGKGFIDTLMLPPCLVPSYRHRPMMNSHRAFFIYRRTLNEQYRNQHRHLPYCQKADWQDHLYRPCPFQRDRKRDNGGQNQAYAS